MIKPAVVYHHNCADGFAAAWCFWRQYGSDMDYIPGIYQTKLPEELCNRTVYLVDFSYKRPDVETLLKRGCNVVLIDHHKSALEDLAPLIDTKAIASFSSLEKSGAVLAWEFTTQEGTPIPIALQHIQDRDLWQFKLPKTREIQAALFSLPYDFEVWHYALQMEDLYPLALAGEAIERKHFKDIEELLTQCKRRVLIAGHDVPVASLPYTMSSDAGHIMAKGEKFAACYIDKADARVFSLRSAEDGLDVSEIAKQFGGGGHKHAAGFAVQRNHPLAQA